MISQKNRIDQVTRIFLGYFVFSGNCAAAAAQLDSRFFKPSGSSLIYKILYKHYQASVARSAVAAI